MREHRTSTYRTRSLDCNKADKSIAATIAQRRLSRSAAAVRAAVATSTVRGRAGCPAAPR